MENQKVSTTLPFVVVAFPALFFAAGCGCQEHSVSEVTVSPPTACLTISAGGGTQGNTKAGAVGLCESLFLFGNNACADPLVVTLPGVDGSPPEQRTASAGAFEIEIGGWSEQEYELEADLGSEQLLIRFTVGGQCGLTGSCD